MSRTTVTVEVDIPTDAQVGDDFQLTGDARIVLIRDPQVEITSIAGKTETLRGEREYELQILNVTLEPTA